MFTNLKNNNRLNVYIPIIANDLKRDYIVGNLIIPYMPYSNIQTIIQKGVAEKLIFILLKKKNFIEDKVRNSKRKKNIYNNSTYSLLIEQVVL